MIAAANTAPRQPSFYEEQPTLFGGKAGAEALPAPGLSARGDLAGPGIDEPITLSAIPGQKFAIPALHEKGEYGGEGGASGAAEK